jgi:expansin (peptidoglycan-binding protein)
MRTARTIPGVAACTLLLLAACGGPDPLQSSRDTNPSQSPHDVDDVNLGPITTYGDPHAGGMYHQGWVEYTGSFTNACAPAPAYDARVQQAEGTLLAGLWVGIPNVSSYCDACILVQTAAGKSALLRVITYGDTTTNSIDVSHDAWTALSSGEWPRDMTWSFAKCPDTGKVMYEFQTGAHEDWTSFWLRNARVPIAQVEVKSARHASWFTLRRDTNGTVNDDGGFGVGQFQIRATAVDGQVMIDAFDWPAGGIAGAFFTGAGNFQ